MIQYTLPIEPMLQKVVHVFYTHNKISPIYGKYFTQCGKIQKFFSQQFYVKSMYLGGLN